jgi:prolyl-tRNA editing enzyme YbaK/EbsC (Cys-tRNA(Pro) deacylase)
MTSATPQTGGESDGAERVRSVLDSVGLAGGIVHFTESTKTAQAAADVVGCELGQIAKSIVFISAGQPVLAVVAGDRRGDAGAIARELGAASARLADEDTVVTATGYPVGAVSPFDLPEELVVVVDESLSRFDTVFPAAGTDSSMVGLTFRQLVALTRGRVALIGR